jgi:hypothetical protein
MNKKKKKKKKKGEKNGRNLEKLKAKRHKLTRRMTSHTIYTESPIDE